MRQFWAVSYSYAVVTLNYKHVQECHKTDFSTKLWRKFQFKNVLKAVPGKDSTCNSRYCARRGLTCLYGGCWNSTGQGRLENHRVLSMRWVSDPNRTREETEIILRFIICLESPLLAHLKWIQYKSYCLFFGPPK